MKKIFIVTAIILLPSVAFATFSIQFDNTTNKKVFYALYWVDAKETIDLNVHYKNGQYFVIWSDRDQWQNKVMMNVNTGITSVKVTPIESKMQK
jgi:hypothetical protein